MNKPETTPPPDSTTSATAPRFTVKQYKTLARRVSLWREAACARGVAIGHKTYRRLSDKPRGRRPDIFKDHWEEMARCLEEQPDQTALELLVEFQARYPGRYSSRQLYTLQKRVRAWRQQAVQRLIGEVSLLPPNVNTRHPDLDKRDAVLAPVKHAARLQSGWPDGHA